MLMNNEGRKYAQVVRNLILVGADFNVRRVRFGRKVTCRHSGWDHLLYGITGSGFVYRSYHDHTSALTPLPKQKLSTITEV